MITLFIVSVLSPLAAILLGIKQRYTLLWFYPAAGLFFDLFGTLLKLTDYNNKWAANLFVLSEFLFLSVYYIKNIFNNKKLFLAFVFILAFAFITQTILNSIFDFNTFGAGIFCIVYVIYGLYGFYSMLKHANPAVLSDSPFFWVNTGIFIYASGSFLLFLFRYYLQSQNPDLFNTIWQTFFLIINITRYLFIGIALYKTKQP